VNDASIVNEGFDVCQLEKNDQHVEFSLSYPFSQRSYFDRYQPGDGNCVSDPVLLFIILHRVKKLEVLGGTLTSSLKARTPYLEQTGTKR